MKETTTVADYVTGLLVLLLGLLDIFGPARLLVRIRRFQRVYIVVLAVVLILVIVSLRVYLFLRR